MPAVAGHDGDGQDLARLRARLASSTVAIAWRPPRSREEALDRLAGLGERLLWAHAEVIFDDPDKLDPRAPRRPRSRVGARLAAVAAATEHEAVVEAAYFVPGSTIDLLANLRRRGVSVRILTNSLDSTDQIPVYAGYAKQRSEMLRLGAELFELRADAAARATYLAPATVNATLGLHAKVYVFDRRYTFIGSFNLERRSLVYNTEDGLLVDSPAFAAEVLAETGRDFQPDSAWRVGLGPHGGTVFSTVRDGHVEFTGFQPGSPLRSILCALYAALPIDALL